MYIRWLKKFKPWKTLAVVGSIAVVGVVIHCPLLHSICDLKAVQMNLQCSLIWELMLYEFEQGHDTMEVTKNICCMKSESPVVHRRVTRWFKKFCSGCNNLDSHAKSGRSKTMDSEAMISATEANPASHSWRVASKLGITHSSVVYYVEDLGRSIHSWQIVPHITKILQNFWLTSV